MFEVNLELPDIAGFITEIKRRQAQGNAAYFTVLEQASETTVKAVMAVGCYAKQDDGILLRLRAYEVMGEANKYDEAKIKELGELIENRKAGLRAKFEAEQIPLREGVIL